MVDELALQVPPLPLSESAFSGMCIGSLHLHGVGGPEAVRKHLMKVGPLANPEFNVDLRYASARMTPRVVSCSATREFVAGPDTLSLSHTRSLTIVDAGDIGVSSLEEGHESLASTVEKIIAQGPCSASSAHKSFEAHALASLSCAQEGFPS
jgi:hypothetical protein